MSQSRLVQASAIRNPSTTDLSVSVATQDAGSVRFDINLTVLPATFNVTFTIEGKDIVSGNWLTLLASAAVVAVGPVVLQVSPRMTAVANLTAQAIVPSQVRLKATGTSTATTWSSAVSLSD